MKRADIVIGDEYAIQIEAPSRWNDDQGRHRRGRVVAVEKIKRHVHTGARWDIGGHAAESWMAQIVDENGEPFSRGEVDEGGRGGVGPGKPSWVVLAKVIRPWADHEALIEAARRKPGEFRVGDLVTVTATGDSGTVVETDTTGYAKVRFGPRVFPLESLRLDRAVEDER